MKEIKYVVEEGAVVPEYHTEDAVGMDVGAFKIIAAFKGETSVSKYKLEKMKKSFIDRGYIRLRDFERVIFGTGIYVELPKNIEIQVRPRGGTSAKKGLLIANSPGTVDPDYRGEIGIITYNSSKHLITVAHNERIAQIVFKEFEQMSLVKIAKEEFDTNTERGAGAYGHTGK